MARAVPVLAISNAKARAVSKKGSRIEISDLPEGSLHHMSEEKSDLYPLFKNAANNNIKHVLIEGGDGTVRTVMTTLLNTYGDSQNLPAVSILPCGTTNQIARNLGLKKISDMSLIKQGQIKTTEMPLVKIRFKGEELGLSNPLFGFLFSTGALPHVSRFAQDQLNSKGVAGGTAVVGAVLKAVTGDKESLMPPAKHRLRGRIGDQSIVKEKGVVLGTVMTTLPTLMLGLDPFWGTEDAPLRLTWAEAESQKLGRNVAGLWLGRKKDRAEDGFYSHNVERLNLKTEAPAALDGDFLNISGQKLRISVSRPVKFWQAA